MARKLAIAVAFDAFLVALATAARLTRAPGLETFLACVVWATLGLVLAHLFLASDSACKRADARLIPAWADASLDTAVAVAIGVCGFYLIAFAYALQTVASLAFRARAYEAAHKEA